MQGDIREVGSVVIGAFVSVLGSFLVGVALRATASDAVGLIGFAFVPSLAATGVVFVVYSVVGSGRVAFAGVALPLSAAAFAVGAIYGGIIAGM